jgi:hypothetical protein
MMIPSPHATACNQRERQTVLAKSFNPWLAVSICLKDFVARREALHLAHGHLPHRLL